MHCLLQCDGSITTVTITVPVITLQPYIDITIHDYIRHRALFTTM